MFPLRDTIPSRHVPWMNWLLIAANLGVFLFELARPAEELQRLFFAYGIVPDRWLAAAAAPPGSPFVQLLTSMFLHAGLLHLGANLWTLWIFGDNVEDRMGPLRFLAFYLLCGVLAGLVHALTNPSSQVPTVGASGAIAGVLGAYLVLFPRSRVLTVVPLFFWPFFFEIPAVAFILIWFLTQLFSGAMALLGPAQVGGVAWWAHVGGFLAGLGLYRSFLARARPRIGW